jgi:amino acid adenylation domain-containing protein
MGPGEAAALAAASAGEAVDWPSGKLTFDRLLEQAQRAPGAEAVRCGAEALSYGELLDRASRIGQALSRGGVERDNLVGVCLPRGVDVPAAMAGVWANGCAYVPLDPKFPEERIAHMISDSNVRMVITTAALAPSLGLPPQSLLLLDAPAALPERAELPPARPTAADPAYVIYTSGSTGTPKGVMVPHGALDNFTRSMARRPGITAADTLVAVTTFSFDIAGLELWVPLTVGARVVVADDDDVRDGARLLALLRSSAATVMQATPATWRLLLESGWNHPIMVLVGGEALPESLARSLRATGSRVWNMYGPTETTIWSAVSPIGDDAVSLGDPIANTSLHVLDSSLELAPAGVPGELCIGGAGLATGYLGRPDLTAERFVEVDIAGRRDRLYRTGDLVRRREDGQLQFLGRIDHQVKLRGYRIELGEIESRLEAHELVSQAVCALRGGDPESQRLAAYVVLDNERRSTAEETDSEVRQWARIWNEAYEPADAGGELDADSRGDADSDGTAESDGDADDFSGWASSLTGGLIPDEQMAEWADATAARIDGLGGQRVLEIGGGTGLLMRRLAPTREAYWAIDVSEASVAKLKRIGQRCAHRIDARIVRIRNAPRGA